MRLLHLGFLGVLATVALAPSLAFGEILYRVTPSKAGDSLGVEMEFVVSAPSIELQMPSWSPGIYALRNTWETLDDVSAVDPTGAALRVTRTRGDTWVVANTGHNRITVRYQRPAPQAKTNSDSMGSDPNCLHYGVDPIYLYIVGRKDEPCVLELVVPLDWKVAVSLERIRIPGSHPTFKAKNYDALIDNPVTMGSHFEGRYEEYGKNHVVAIRGPAKDWIDRERTLQATRFVTRIETGFFGGAPYDQYVWHFRVHEGRPLAGGTEHASSTEMHLSTEEGRSVVAGMAHEFFHLWNAKRIRPKSIGAPFDYTRLPQTGALWWLEGITEYYSFLLPYRNGAWGREAFLTDALSQILKVRANPARLTISPYESSARMAEKSSAGGSSSGYQVDFYSTGMVLGILFDIELRTRSNGERSLDDVERALWELCKNDRPGFDEEEIRRQLVRFGGPEMGPLYDLWVRAPGDLPVELQLAKVGLEILNAAGGSDGRRSVIQERSDITAQQRRLLEDWLRSRAPDQIQTPFPPLSRPQSVQLNLESARAFTGRYDLAEYLMLTIALNEGRLTASLGDDRGAELIPVSADTFFHSARNARLSFIKDGQGDVSGITWRQNGHERTIPRIGPFVRSLRPNPDPNTALTGRVESALRALASGVNGNVNSTNLSDGALKDFGASGPIHQLAGAKPLQYIASQDVASRGIERHHGKVGQINYYKLTTDRLTTFLLVFLTPEGLVTDFDFVDD
jgi:predicted metalloprotease with PDZ domain